eukprot:m.13874 g.13874  ORF g.13874 m.13874 type:complete len:718 (-) comp4680_c0_seq2:199-2352(-)
MGDPSRCHKGHLLGCVPVGAASLSARMWHMFGPQVAEQAAQQIKARRSSSSRPVVLDIDAERLLIVADDDGGGEATAAAVGDDLATSTAGLSMQSPVKGAGSASSSTAAANPADSIVAWELSPSLMFACVLPKEKKKVAFVADSPQLGLLFCYVVQVRDKAAAQALNAALAKVLWRPSSEAHRAAPDSGSARISRLIDSDWAETDESRQITSIRASTFAIQEVKYLGHAPVLHYVPGTPPMVQPQVVVSAVSVVVTKAPSKRTLKRRLSLSRAPSTDVDPDAGTDAVLVISADGIRAVNTTSREEIHFAFLRSLASFTEASSKSEKDKDLFVYVSVDERLKRATCYVFRCPKDQAKETCSKVETAIKGSQQVDEIRRGQPFMPTERLTQTDFDFPLMTREIDRVTIVPQYEIGSGQFGVVYLAEQRLPDGGTPEHAVKLLRENSISPSDLPDFLSEAEILAELDHDHVVTLLGVCLKQRPWLLVMELCAFGDLDKVLTACKERAVVVPMAEVLLLAAQLGSALAYLASLSLCHNNVAAENCLLHNNNKLKLGDFGAAQRLEPGKKHKRLEEPLKVSPRWLPPEVLEDRIISEASDVWQFGVTVWEFLTFGETPFARVHFLQVPRRIAEGTRPEQPMGCPDSVYELLQRCWHKDRGKRPAASSLQERVLDLRLTLPPSTPLPCIGAALHQSLVFARGSAEESTDDMPSAALDRSASAL